MPFDTSGNFNRAKGDHNWRNDATSKVRIRADLHDENDNDFAQALSDCITRHGWSQIAEDISWNGKKITNLGTPTEPGDAMTLGYFDASAVRYDKPQTLTVPQQNQAHVNLAATDAVEVKSSAYTLVSADRHKLLRVTGTCTLTLPLAETVGNDYAVHFRTMGGVLTLGRNGALIEGLAADYVIPDETNGTLWCDGVNWFVSSGVKVLIKRTVLTSTPALNTHTYDKSTKWVNVKVQGGGGGGGGTNTDATAGKAAAGAGGSAGGFAEKWLKVTAASATVLVGAAGNGGSTTGNNGGAGGTTSFTDGSTVVQATGGGGGVGTIQGVHGSMSSGASAGGVGSGGDTNVQGGLGGWSIAFGTSSIATPFGRAGQGADSRYGAGGSSGVATSATGAISAGGNASGRGAGGGGSINLNTAAGANAGDGTGGLVEIEEYA